jgi:RimJ/RimL family protein N-acetyltransferase
MIRVEPMTEERFTAFLEETIVRYAEENVRTGRWDAAGAVEHSRAEHARLLPQGLATPHEYLRSIFAGDSGERVGDLWFSHRSEGGPKQIWIFWIGIDPAHRRHGYAIEALRAIEVEARQLGSTRVGLHVFASNSGARALYERLGYAPTNLVMWKELPASAAPAP